MFFPVSVKFPRAIVAVPMLLERVMFPAPVPVPAVKVSGWELFAEPAIALLIVMFPPSEFEVENVFKPVPFNVTVPVPSKRIGVFVVVIERAVVSESSPITAFPFPESVKPFGAVMEAAFLRFNVP